jgi:hypothetical protein
MRRNIPQSREQAIEYGKEHALENNVGTSSHNAKRGHILQK